MTIRILNPRDWEQLEPTYSIPLNGDRSRIVKIEFNTAGPAAIHMSYDSEPDPDGAVTELVTFLGMVNGLDKIEVVADPGSQIIATCDAEVWYCTNEGQFTASPPALDENGNPEGSFTKLIGERTRADILEEMVLMANRNFQVLRDQQAQERADAEILAQRLAAAEAALGTTGAQQATAAEPGADQGQAQSASGDEPGVSA